LRIRFCGVRGSTPVSGAEFARVGGHTSNLAVSVDDELPTLLLDAGTGLQVLGKVFDGAPFIGTILLTHLHWDHVQGIPFFPPGDHVDARVTCIQPEQGDAYATMARSMSPPHFPIQPDGLKGKWTHVGLEPGVHNIEKFEVTAGDVEHKGGRTFGYRVACNGSSFAYVPDALDANDDAIIELAAGADLLIRGAPFCTEEQERADLYGHGTVEHAVVVAKKAGVRRLIITHHGPHRPDDGVDKLAAMVGATPAYEGMIVDV
jgi:phosphoribosyl 1,2-cyclic phosphodiesterase